jgi:hypothetical protein
MTTPGHSPIGPTNIPTTNPTSPNDDRLIVRWGHNGSISTAVPTWIPPDDNYPPPAAARPTKSLRSKGMLHANKLLGKYEVPTDFDGPTKSFPLQRRLPPASTFKFDGMLWSSSCLDDMPLDQVPTIANKNYAAKLPPEDLRSEGHQEPVGCTASFDHLGRRGTPAALPKFPNGSNDMEQSKGHQGFVGRTALFDHPGRRGTPKALPKFPDESDALNKTKSPAPGQPSTPMAEKPTPQ